MGLPIPPPRLFAGIKRAGAVGQVSAGQGVAGLGLVGQLWLMAVAVSCSLFCKMVRVTQYKRIILMSLTNKYQQFMKGHLAVGESGTILLLLGSPGYSLCWTRLGSLASRWMPCSRLCTQGQTALSW